MLTKKPYLIYGNGDCQNHGCEAIYRGTINLLGLPQTIRSSNVEIDKKSLPEFAEIINSAKGKYKRNLVYWKRYLRLRIKKEKTAMDVIPFLSAIEEDSMDISIALSVGGDNYCYSDQEFYGDLNAAYNRSGIRTILWGCSIEPKLLNRPDILRDLRSYSLIFARESISYEALVDKGIRALHFPDPAFFMETVLTDEINSKYLGKPSIGINLSPMVISNEKKSGLIFDSAVKLIEYLLNSTSYQILLIPHVIWKTNDDRVVLNEIKEKFKSCNRIKLVEDLPAPQLKGIISRCDALVASRTHAAIAGYSSNIPVLAIGYSVKARGLVKDIYGDDSYCLVESDKFESEEELTDMMVKILNDRDILKKKSKLYNAWAKDIRTTLENYFDNFSTSSLNLSE